MELLKRVKRYVPLFRGTFHSFTFYFSILIHHPSGLNGHPIVDDFCQLLESQGCKVPFFLAFLVDRMEESMKSKVEMRKELLPKADQVS